MAEHAHRITRAWRAEIPLLSLFVLSCGFSVGLSKILPWTVITGPLLGQTYLSLPLASFVPFAILTILIFRMYNEVYVIDERGLEAQMGILALHKNSPRVRFEDIRLVDVKQNLLGRMFDFGSLEIGTAAKEGVELVFSGVASPYDIRDFITAEVDKRQRFARERAHDVRLKAMSGD